MNTRSITPPRFVTLIALSGLSIATLNLFVPSLANIAAEFGVSYGLVNLSIAAYAIASGCMQLLSGPLSDRFGRRPILLTFLGVFTLASIGCSLAQDIYTFLAFRMLQATIVSGYVISLAVVRDTHSSSRAASLLGYMAMAWAIAPMVAPMLGGLLDEWFGWRASFWAFICFGILMFVVCWFDLGETNQQKSASIAGQFRTYPELFKSRRFWGYSFCAAFSIGAFYAFLGGAPLVATRVFGITPATLGFYMASTTAGFIAGSFLGGRYAERFQLTTMIILGPIVAATGLTLGLTILKLGIVHEFFYFGACAFVGLGNGITMPSVSTGIMSVRPGTRR